MALSRILNISLKFFSSWTLAKFVLSIPILCLIAWAANVIYNIYFHPLASFPGPWSRAGLYSVDLYSHYKGGNHRDLRKLHEKYGEVVRIAPDSLSFNTAQAGRDIYAHQPGKAELRKDASFYGRPEDLPVQSLIECDEPNHTRLRRSLSHGFSEQALREQEPYIAKYFDLLVSRLQDQIKSPKNGVVDMVRWYNFLTFDIIGDLCFGDPFNALANGEYHFWIDNINKMLKFAWFLKVAHRFPSIGSAIKLAVYLFPGFGTALKEHIKYANLKSEMRIDNKTERVDIMTYVLRYNNEKENGMTRHEIIHAGAAMILAGSETTAGAMSAATYFLLKHPIKLARVRDEVRSAFSSAEEISLTTTRQLKYLLAVLEESLRLYPPVPIALPRRTGPEGDVINGQFVPGNTSVALHHWSTTRSARNFANPDNFVPERWLEDPPAPYDRDDRSSLQPFSLGPRNCLGKNLAYAEMRSVMARMLWRFDMELCEESDNWSDHDVQTLWNKPPLMIKLSNRVI